MDYDSFEEDEGCLMDDLADEVTPDEIEEY